MLAPRRLPPCLTASVAISKTFMNEIGPDAVPPVEATMSPGGPEAGEREPGPSSGLMDYRCELHRIEDLFDGVAHRDDEACGQLLHRVPAFMIVGELGRNSSDRIMRWNSCASASASRSLWKWSTEAMLRAIRQNMSSGVSMTSPRPAFEQVPLLKHFQGVRAELGEHIGHLRSFGRSKADKTLETGHVSGAERN